MEKDSEKKPLTKNKLLSKRNLVRILIITLVLIVAPALIYKLAITPGTYGFIRESDAGSWVGYYGSIVGGAITFYGVWFSIDKQEKIRNEDYRNQTKIRKQDQEAFEKRRKEDQRMSVMPFLSYSVLSDPKPSNNRIVYEYYTELSHPGKNIVDSFEKDEIYIEVKNLGIGVAVFPSIRLTTYCGFTQEDHENPSISIGPGEGALLTFCLEYPEYQLPTFCFKFGYFDILNYYYTQYITTEFINDDSNYSVSIIEIEKPNLSGPPKRIY